MSLPKVIPALANLTQDIAGPVPVKLLQDWAKGEQNLDAARSLLDSFRIAGTVVSTDGSGLTRMTRAMDLLDVVQLVSEPKEIVHALSCEIGGRGIGTWVADNTETFFPTTVAVDDVLEAMAEVQCRVHERHQVQIGMCVHHGCFYEIGGGLYGPDADHVEDLAENYAVGGEILVTETVVRESVRIRSEELELKCFERSCGNGNVFAHRSPRRMQYLAETQTHYPHPFPENFYRLLPLLRDPVRGPETRQQLYADWLREAVVVFLARHREQIEERSLSDLLDDLVANACMDALIRNGAPGSGEIATSGGGLAILTFDNAQYALDYVRMLFPELTNNGLDVVAAIDKGPVLNFNSLHGRSGITGDPVNIASKLAEDAGAPGQIYLTDRVYAALASQGPCQTFRKIASGVTLNGYTLGCN